MVQFFDPDNYEGNLSHSVNRAIQQFTQAKMHQIMEQQQYNVNQQRAEAERQRVAGVYSKDNLVSPGQAEILANTDQRYRQTLMPGFMQANAMANQGLGISESMANQEQQPQSLTPEQTAAFRQDAFNRFPVRSGSMAPEGQVISAQNRPMQPQQDALANQREAYLQSLQPKPQVTPQAPQGQQDVGPSLMPGERVPTQEEFSKMTPKQREQWATRKALSMGNPKQQLDELYKKSTIALHEQQLKEQKNKAVVAENKPYTAPLYKEVKNSMEGLENVVKAYGYWLNGDVATAFKGSELPQQLRGTNTDLYNQHSIQAQKNLLHGTGVLSGVKLKWGAEGKFGIKQPNRESQHESMKDVYEGFLYTPLHTAIIDRIKDNNDGFEPRNLSSLVEKEYMRVKHNPEEYGFPATLEQTREYDKWIDKKIDAGMPVEMIRDPKEYQNGDILPVGTMRAYKVVGDKLQELPQEEVKKLFPQGVGSGKLF